MKVDEMPDVLSNAVHELRDTLVGGDFHCANLLYVHQPDAVVRISARLRAAGNHPIRGVKYEKTDLFPTTVAIECDHVNYVYVSGTDDVDQVLNYIFSFPRDFNIDTPADRVWPPFWKQGGELLSAINNQAPDKGGLTVLVGHSYGGAICQCCAIRGRHEGDKRHWKVFTYGAPKSVSEEILEKVSGVSMVRFENVDDSIPLLPPAIKDLPFPVTKFYLANKIVPPTLVPAGAECVLSPDGLAKWYQFRGPLILNAVIEIAALADAIIGIGNGHQHKLSSYNKNLVKALEVEKLTPLVERPEDEAALLLRESDLFPPMPNGPTLRAAVEMGGGNKTPGMELIPATISPPRRAYFSPVSLLNVEVTPVALGKVPRAHQMRTVDLTGGIWGVVWEGRVISQGPSRGRQLTVCRNWLKALRRLQSAQNVSTSLFLLSVSDYIAAASTPGNGFAPLL